MIKREFLGLKYQGLKTIYELQESGHLKTDIGWKCRKYIRWRDVHEKQADREILKLFGDSLVDENKIKLEYLGDINAILLKVQKWRLDKETFSVEPALEPAYEKVIILLDNVNSYPSYIGSYLKDKGLINGSTEYDIQSIFYLNVLKEYFESITRLSVPLILSNESINVNIFYFFERIYKDHGLNQFSLNDYREIILSIYKDLGFSISFHEEIEIENKDIIKELRVVINYKKMNLSEFMNVSNIANTTYIELNKNNLYIKEILDSENVIIKEYFEIFIKSLSNSYIDLIEKQDVLDTFFNYLSLKLNDEIRRSR